MRETVHLNYDWGFSKGWENDEFQQVNIPHTNKMLPFNYFDEKDFQFKSRYVKKIKIEQRQDHVVMLKFYGVSNYCVVKINGVTAGEHKGGYDAFLVDLTKHITKTQSYEIEVLTDSFEDPLIPPFGGVVDYICYGGIYREVELLYLPTAHLSDVFLHTSFDNEWFLNVEFNAKNLVDYKIKILVNDQEFLSTITDESFKQSLKITGVKTWSTDSPNLYDVRLTLLDQNPIDEIVERIGFRTAEFKKDGFYLNGEKIKIRGLNRHQSYAYAGYAMPASMQIQDADILKYDLGCNLVRTSHYPQSKHFINRCDEIGLLVFTEIVGWQHISKQPSWRQLVEDSCTNMILQYRNHPSIIIWGVRVNESQDDHDLYTKTNSIAKRLDPTRATGGVRFIDNSELLEDVYTFNDFSHIGSNNGLRKKSSVTKHSNNPYMITEYNGHMYPTKTFDDETHRTSHALRHANVLDAMMKDDEISGCIGWCMNDYNTHKDFGSGDRICYHGVLDMFRMPKLASAVYSSQQKEQPVLEINTGMQIGEHAKGLIEEIVVFTNCEEIALFKNDQFVKKFGQDNTKHKALEFPPIFIDDLIGDLIKQNESYPEKVAVEIKKLLLDIYRYSVGNLPAKTKLRALKLMFRHKITMDDFVVLYNKYIGNWGMESVDIKIVGYQKNEIVAERVVSAYRKTQFDVRYSSTVLTEQNTYDVLQVFIKALDQNKNTLNYYFAPVNVEVEEGIEVYGPTHFCMIAGQASFYIKSKQKAGRFKVKITIEKETFVETIEVKN